MSENTTNSGSPSKPQNTNKSGFRGGSKGVATQWKPGESGNPGGRPKSKLISEALRHKLAEIERTGNRTAAEAIAEAAIKKARKGFIGAMDAIADRVEGRPAQSIHMTTGIDQRTAEVLAGLAERLLSKDELAGVETGAGSSPTRAREDK